MADRREPAAIGRRARLELIFGTVRGRTQLVHGYAEPPLRIGRALSWGDRGVQVILASSAPGVFGGDRFEQHVIVERGARVLLTSQSATQVHPSSPSRLAQIRARFVIDDEATLACHWDPLIPFAGSQLDQKLDVTLAPTGRLAWSDGLMAGRAGRGERWVFDAIAHELRIHRAGRLEYLERQQLRPSEDPLTGPWAAGSMCYLGSTVISGWPVTAEHAERMHQACVGERGLQAAVDLVEPRLLLARFASEDGPAFHHARARVFEAAVNACGESVLGHAER